ncbi:MAG: amidohydrolase family protein [Acidobacteria bacterium]|jgi:predicted TIM-barrel fold metal-dependent hydrolase|nr:amidohydrolase family protein [Bryobacteraceae bacterium CoA2 C42]MCA2964412.1 amidohydrolase [Acidobacteriaceae bacterium]
MNRRELLTAGLAATASAAATNPVKIDCQSHLFSAEFLALLEKRQTAPYVYRKGPDRFVVVGQWHRKLMPTHTDVQAKLAVMDQANIAMTALSINDPGPELFGDDSPAMARLLNDFIAATVRQHPTRFFGLATLPFNSAKAMMDEFDRAINRLGMKGILLYSNLNGRFSDEDEFRPLFAEAERRGVPLLLHPAYPLTYEATKGREMTGGLGLMFDTTIALGRIIMAGILEQHPKLKLVCPHVGGALPYLIGRVDHQAMVLKRGAENIKRPPSEYLQNIWLDTVSPRAQAIRYGYDFVGPDRLLFSSDHPWVEPALIAGEIAKLKLPPADEAKIFAGNARKLFNL